MPLEPIYSGYTPFGLRNELVTDPRNLGYSGFLASGDYIAVANALASIRSGAAYDIWRKDISPKEIVNSIQPVDFAKLSTLQAQQLQVLFVASPVDATLSGVRSNFTIVFSGASGTIDNLTALASRQGSRAEVLFGPGVSITDDQVRFAWSLSSGLSG